MSEPVIRIETNAQQQILGLRGKLSLLQHEQLPRAMSWAINRTLVDTHRQVLDFMKGHFKKVSYWTEHGFKVLPVHMGEMTGEVYFAMQPGKHGADTTPYLKPEQEGGERPEKPNEVMIAADGTIGMGDEMVPFKAVAVNGNLPYKLYTKIISALGIFSTGTGLKDKTVASRLKMHDKFKNDIFVGTPKGGRGPFGIYSRGAISGKFMPLMKRKTDMNYKQQFPFYLMAGKYLVEGFDVNMNKAFADALYKAGLGGSDLGLPGMNALEPGAD